MTTPTTKPDMLWPSLLWRGLRWVVIVALVALVLAFTVWRLSRDRTFQFFGDLVSRVETSEKVVALTFDDGPSASFTSEVLAVLNEKGVKATFFLIGRDLERNFDQGKAIAEAGHEIGNHTYTHPDMTLAGMSHAAAEIEPTDTLIRATGYTGDILFRPPYGKKLVGLPLYLARHDRTTVTWDVEPESYKHIAGDPALIAEHVVEKVRPGSIVILHVMYASRAVSRQALPMVIDGLREQGYSFVTVSELMQMKSPPQ